MYFGFISSFEPTNVDEYRQKVNCMNKHKLINDQFPTITDKLKENWHMVYKLAFVFQIKTWIDTFSSLGDKRTGYAKERVTCYMHAAAYHIPHMVTQHNNLKQFSGQGTVLVLLYIWNTNYPNLSKKPIQVL